MLFSSFSIINSTWRKKLRITNFPVKCLETSFVFWWKKVIISSQSWQHWRHVFGSYLSNGNDFAVFSKTSSFTCACLWVLRTSCIVDLSTFRTWNKMTFIVKSMNWVMGLEAEKQGELMNATFSEVYLNWNLAPKT